MNLRRNFGEIYFTLTISGNACGLKTCNKSQKCCKFQTCSDLSSNDITDPRTWTCEENCPINQISCSQNKGKN